MTSNPTPPDNQPIPFLKLSITGFFMGLANLVPGVSGGTMVLALGLYDEFIGSMSNLTRVIPRIFSDGPVKAALWFSRSAIVLAMLFGLSFLTIAVLSGIIEYLMAMFQPGMLALFIGMTLGGAPMLWKDMKPLNGSNIGGFVVGFAIMAIVAILRPGGGDPGWLLFFIGGLVASSSMILPGISGSYMLLILGLYIPVISGISEAVHSLKDRDFATVMDLGIGIGLPVGLGLLIGIVVFSNLIKYCMDNFKKPTIGFLMGLLLGSVLGLYPFQTASVAKLPRYATDGVLSVYGFGWENQEGDPVYGKLMELNSDSTRVEIIAVDSESAPTVEAIALARTSNAIVVAYDEIVPREVKREAAIDTAEKPEVELVFIPNSERTTTKTIIAVLLALLGICITLGLGRLGGKKDPKPTPEEVAA